MANNARITLVGELYQADATSIVLRALTLQNPTQ